MKPFLMEPGDTLELTGTIWMERKSFLGLITTKVAWDTTKLGKYMATTHCRVTIKYVFLENALDFEVRTEVEELG